MTVKLFDQLEVLKNTSACKQLNLNSKSKMILIKVMLVMTIKKLRYTHNYYVSRTFRAGQQLNLNCTVKASKRCVRGVTSPKVTTDDMTQHFESFYLYFFS